MTYSFPSQGGCNVTLPGPSLQSLCSAAEYVYFMTALDAAIRSNPNISGNCERVVPIDEPAKEYDFIVVGAGAGGAAVAGRLSEVADWKVFVLDAGEDESAAGQIPAFAGALTGAEIDWNYYTTNETYACLSNNGSCYWSAAKSLGGNTAHSGMLYVRGSPEVYNYWAALGNNGWAWDNVLKFYKNQEDNANIDKVGRKFHGTGGPLPVGFFPYVSKWTEPLLKAANQSGLGVTEDLNGKNLTGFTVAQATQKHGVRVSSASAYLRPHRDNKNLDISVNSYVTRIIIENGTAMGIEFIKDGELKRVYAKREVIISAGSIRSPQLLLLSGIGPKEHLKSKGIKVVLDLPGVGKNLQDHVGVILTWTINRTDTFENNVLVAQEYLQNQTGLMSTISGLLFVGAAQTNRTTLNAPDLHLLMQGYIASCAPGEVGALRSNGSREITFWIANTHPESRGQISLASNNPLDYPVMWGNYLSEEVDVDVIIDGIQMAIKLTEAEALREYNFTLSFPNLEACSNYTIPSREYWACVVRQETHAGWHQVGTCKMGPASDSMAVVDPELRVHGMKNLRVVDASIMPLVTSANTGGPSMMIGEQGAYFIKKTWLSSYE